MVATAAVAGGDFGPQPPGPPCNNPPLSRIPFYFVGNAAFDHMVRWIEHGIAPPIAPEIELEVLGPPTVIKRDAFGNALGGIRLSQLVNPTATNTGLNSGPGYCSLYGTFLPFDNALIQALYRNHGAYVSQVSRVTFDNLLSGFIVMEDAEATVREAAQSGIGKRQLATHVHRELLPGWGAALPVQACPLQGALPVRK